MKFQFLILFYLDELKTQFHSFVINTLDHNQTRTDFDFNDDALKDIAEAMAITSFQLYFLKSNPKLTIEFYKRLFIPWLPSVNSNFSTALYSDWLDEFNVMTGVASDINYKSLDIMAMRLIANLSVEFYNLFSKSANSNYDLKFQYHELISDQLGLNVLHEDWFDIGLSSNSKFFPFNFNRSNKDEWFFLKQIQLMFKKQQPVHIFSDTKDYSLDQPYPYICVQTVMITLISQRLTGLLQILGDVSRASI